MRPDDKLRAAPQPETYQPSSLPRLKSGKPKKPPGGDRPMGPSRSGKSAVESARRLSKIGPSGPSRSRLGLPAVRSLSRSRPGLRAVLSSFRSSWRPHARRGPPPNGWYVQSEARNEL